MAKKKKKSKKGNKSKGKKSSKSKGKLSKNMFSKSRKRAEKARKSRFENAPVGQHICKFTDYSQGTGKGGDYVNMQFTIVDGEHQGKKFSKYYELSEDRLSFLLGDLGIFGFEIEEINSVEDVVEALDELKEEKPLLKIRVSENGDYTNTYINKVFTDEEAETLDIEDEDADESDDEEEDEDSEDDEEEDDEEESDDEEEDEDEEEDDEEWHPSKGDRVNVTLADGEEYPGKVTRCSVAKEICSVDFDDGDSETGLAWEDISQLEEDADDEDEEEPDEDEEETEDEDDESEDEDSDEEEDEDEEDELEMTKGMRVSFKKGRKTIKGKITKLDEENKTVNIKDDKGKTHKKIDGSKLELLGD